MRNAIDVLFGRGVVALLKKQPGALRRIASTAKPLLLGAVHPDRNHQIGSESAAEFSEAFQTLSEATPEELEKMIDEFLTAERQNSLRSELRELRETKARNESTIQTQIKEIARLKSLQDQFIDNNASFATEMWLWVANGSGLTPKSLKTVPKEILPKGAIPRGSIHYYRMIILGDDGEYHALEFDPSGSVLLHFVTHSLYDAREARVHRRKWPERPGVSKSHGHAATILGSTEEKFSSTKATVSIVQDRTLKPYLSVGRFPVFAVMHTYADLSKGLTSTLKEGLNGKIVEMLPLAKIRAAYVHKLPRNMETSTVAALSNRLKRMTSLFRTIRSHWIIRYEKELAEKAEKAEKEAEAAKRKAELKKEKAQAKS